MNEMNENYSSLYENLKSECLDSIHTKFFPNTGTVSIKIKQCY